MQTEHSLSKSANKNSQATKEGPIVQVGSPETNYDFSSIMCIGDPLQEDLKKALDNNELVELWNIYIDPDDIKDPNAEHKASYAQGYITDYSESSPAEDNVTINYSYAVNLIPQDGTVTLTLEEAEAIQYKFRDLEAVVANNATTGE